MSQSRPSCRDACGGGLDGFGQWIGGAGRLPPMLVHKMLRSMPPGTPAQKVLQTVKNLARDEFGLKHRYAMVLHIDEPRPSVHMPGSILLKVRQAKPGGVGSHVKENATENF